MSNWGVGIFDSDIAQEVKESYVSGLQKGIEADEVVAGIHDFCRDYLQDPDDACDYWLALASVTYDHGCLTDDVKTKAFEMIEYDMSSDRWAGKLRSNRQVKLDELRIKLSSEQPPKKNVRRLKPFIPKIKPNEILEFRLDDDRFEGAYFYNSYIYVLVDRWEQYDARITGLGDQYPVVHFKYSAERITDISKVDQAKWMICSTQMNPDESIDDALERRIHDDNKVRMMNSGFNKFIKNLHSLGIYDYVRPTRVTPFVRRYTDDWNMVISNRLVPSLIKWETYYTST